MSQATGFNHSVFTFTLLSSEEQRGEDWESSNNNTSTLHVMKTDAVHVSLLSPIPFATGEREYNGTYVKR